jgi:glycosyltransferase involved in cell wall biosynthesis
MTGGPMRIAVALSGIHRVNRGAETAIERIAAGLAQLGHAVTVFGSGPERPEAPYQYQRIATVPREKFERWPGFPPMRSHYNWEELTFAFGLARRFRPSAFDATLGCTFPFVNLVLRRGGAKHVYVTQNGDWPAHARESEFRLFSCDGLVCTNPQYFARNSARWRSVLIPNGVDPDVFSPAPGDRAAFGLPAGPPIALMVSALIPSKRVEAGIQAVAGTPDVFLVVAGDGELRAEVDEAGARLLPGRYKRLTLPRARMPELYRCADLFLHMSTDEPSANAYMEALATGLPIVTHDWEVTRWTLEDCGIVVDSQQIPLVTDAIGRALQQRGPDHTARRRALIDRRFSWRQISADYATFIRDLIG